MDFFKHQHALCETTRVGPRTRIWAFAHVLPGATLGADCNICDGVFIENDVVIGDRVTIKSGVQLWDGVVVEDDVFIGPNATFTNDHHPRSKAYPERFLRTFVRQGASIGANATILPGLEIGAGAMVGAGAVVTRSVPPHAIVVGNPARITGYVGAEAAEGEAVSHQPTGNILRAIPAEVSGVQIYHFPWVKDMRGDLMVAEFERAFPSALSAISWSSACHHVRCAASTRTKSATSFSFACTDRAVSWLITGRRDGSSSWRARPSEFTFRR